MAGPDTVAAVPATGTPDWAFRVQSVRDKGAARVGVVELVAHGEGAAHLREVDSRNRACRRHQSLGADDVALGREVAVESGCHRRE